MSSVVQRRRPRVGIAQQAGNLYWSPERQHVMDHRSRTTSFEMRAADEMTKIARGKTTFYSSPQKQRIQDHRFGTSAADKTKTAAQTSRRQSIDSICCIYMHSEHSGATIETCSSGGGSVCSEDSRTESDSKASTSSITAISIQQQPMEELHTTLVCPYFLDQADKVINLPDDVIRNVLRRLTVKEIMRLGCLNRSWRSELQRIINDDGHDLSQYRSIHPDAAAKKGTPPTYFNSSLKSYVQ